jgi:hypothetical protein
MVVAAVVAATVVSCYFGMLLLLGDFYIAAENCVCLMIPLWIYIIGLQ